MWIRVTILWECMALLDKLDKLLAKEIISLTIVVTSGMSSIMMMAKLPRYANVLFSAPDVGTTFLMLMLYILPSVLKYTVPVALLLACAIVAMRMSADRELDGWLASGVSIFRLSYMPCFLGSMVVCISLVSGLYFEPYSNTQFKKFERLQTQRIVEIFINNSFREKAFVSDFPAAENLSVAMYFDKVYKNRTKFDSVFLALGKSKEPYSHFILAQHGSLKRETNQGFTDIIFELTDGSVYFFQNQNWSRTQFSTLDLSLMSAFRNKLKIEPELKNNLDQLYPKEFWQVLNKEKEKSPNWKQDPKIISKFLFFFKQISIPLSTIFLPTIGLCLGFLDPRKKQISVYLGIGVVIFLLYASLSLCQQMALNFLVSPYLLLFVTPVLLLLTLLVVVRWRLCHPPSVGFLEFISQGCPPFWKICFQKSRKS